MHTRTPVRDHTEFHRLAGPPARRDKPSVCRSGERLPDQRLHGTLHGRRFQTVGTCYRHFQRAHRWRRFPPARSLGETSVTARHLFTSGDPRRPGLHGGAVHRPTRSGGPV
ncbi:MAG: hypothetical protein MZV64_49265 [Ignavibacteriales bacterium]|nr:hypothetical protein [Ignavibacteriales bacterium]